MCADLHKDRADREDRTADTQNGSEEIQPAIRREESMKKLP
jgi:hypothetical protein